jgi:hypothetical protein
MVAAVVVASLGCDGSGGPGGLSSAGQPTYKSASFFPLTATDANGQAASELWWRQRLNGGAPAAFVSQGLPGTVKLDDIEIRLETASLQRTTTTSGTITLQDPNNGTVTSTFRQDTVDTFSAGPPSVLTRETAHQTQALSGSRIHGTLDIEGVVAYAMPVSIVVDRTDLDQLAVGHVDQLDYMSTTTVTGTVSQGGQPNTSTNVETDMVHEAWAVAAQLPSLAVLGTTYTRVVQIERQVDTTNVATGVQASLKSTLWFAAGIGIVHGISTESDIPELAGLPTDLVDTNLRQ